MTPHTQTPFRRLVAVYLEYDREGTLEQMRRVMTTFAMPAVHMLVDGAQRISEVRRLELFNEEVCHLEVFEPSHKLTFVVHLDGMREIHDYICDYPGLWDIAVDAIKQARAKGFRVTTNTTIFKETSIEDVIEMMGYLTDDVGIDGMLIAPGYQYSQIDPALTMTRAEHEEKFKVIRTVARERGYRWLATPIYQEFLTGERKLKCAPWGSNTRYPYGW